MIMHEQTVTQWVLIILGVLGALKTLTALVSSLALISATARRSGDGSVFLT
jgi:hypothetical protein